MLHNDSYIHCRILVLHFSIAKQPALLCGSKLRPTVFERRMVTNQLPLEDRAGGAGKGLAKEGPPHTVLLQWPERDDVKLTLYAHGLYMWSWQWNGKGVSNSTVVPRSHSCCPYSLLTIEERWHLSSPSLFPHHTSTVVTDWWLDLKGLFQP